MRLWVLKKHCAKQGSVVLCMWWVLGLGAPGCLARLVPCQPGPLPGWPLARLALPTLPVPAATLPSPPYPDLPACRTLVSLNHDTQMCMVGRRRVDGLREGTGRRGGWQPGARCRPSCSSQHPAAFHSLHFLLCLFLTGP